MAVEIYIIFLCVISLFFMNISIQNISYFQKVCEYFNNSATFQAPPNSLRYKTNFDMLIFLLFINLLQADINFLAASEHMFFKKHWPHNA